MSASIQSKLEKLQADYNQVRGRPFNHFFCPVLFKDEDVLLCKAHIINLAFPNSSRAWTVQRSDVDNFYGSNFEADFIAIQYTGRWSPGEVLTDRTLSKRFNPKIAVDGEPVDYFVAHGNIPKHFTWIEFDDGERTIQLGLKMLPEDVLAAAGQKWEIEISKDVRVPVLVSLIKAAHLTLFEMLGYRYALSAGGYFVGRQILGEFFWQNYNKSKAEVLENAYSFFREFAHMVRPVQSCSLDLQGTITDGLLFICRGNDGSPWALIVFIKTSQSLHAVMIPIFDQPDAVAMFMGFLQNADDSVEANLCRFEQDQWKINKQSSKLFWPKSGILYP
jgi:hypothetical protein